MVGCRVPILGHTGADWPTDWPTQAIRPVFTGFLYGLKTVSGAFLRRGFESLPLRLCEVSGDPGHMSREIPDSLCPRRRLIDAAGVEHELADQLAV